MSLDQLVPILQQSLLDQETKLFVIDLISMSDDPRFIEDVMTLLLEWKKSDTEAVSVLHEGLFKLATEFNARQEQLDMSQQRIALSVADVIAREEKIQKIRDHLMTI